MVVASEASRFVLQTTCFFIGVVGNSYIVAMSVKDTTRFGRLSPRLQLVTGIGCLSLCLQVFMAANDMCLYIWTETYVQENVMKFFMLGGMALVSAVLWLSTWLSVYCSIKISNSQPVFLRWLQLKLPIAVPWFILGSVLLSVGLTLPGVSDLYITRNKVNFNPFRNYSLITYNAYSHCSCFLWIFFSVSSLAFGMFLSSALTILTSLFRHVRKMKNMTSSTGNKQFNKLLAAARTVTSLLVLCLLFYTAQIFLFTGLFPFGTLNFLIMMSVISIFPGLNSLILITGNQALKKPLNEIVKHFCLK